MVEQGDMSSRKYRILHKGTDIISRKVWKKCPLILQFIYVQIPDSTDAQQSTAREGELAIRNPTLDKISSNFLFVTPDVVYPEGAWAEFRRSPNEPEAGYSVAFGWFAYTKYQPITVVQNGIILSVQQYHSTLNGFHLTVVLLVVY